MTFAKITLYCILKSRRGVEVSTTAQSSKPELGFCAVSNTHFVMRRTSRLEIRLNVVRCATNLQKKFIIIIIIIILIILISSLILFSNLLLRIGSFPPAFFFLLTPSLLVKKLLLHHQ